MIVVDASVAVMLFVDPDADPRGKRARAALGRDPAWVVPEHWRTEVFNSLRGLWLGRKLSTMRASHAVESLTHLRVEVAPADPLLPRMWQLRGNVTGYDAAYIATAEAYGCRLVTTDSRLSRAGVARCPIEVIG